MTKFLSACGRSFLRARRDEMCYTECRIRKGGIPVKRILLCILTVALVLGLAVLLISRDVWPAAGSVSGTVPAAGSASDPVPEVSVRPLVIVTAAPEPVPTEPPAVLPSGGSEGRNG